MTAGLIVPIALLVALLAAVATYRARRERRTRRAVPLGPGWTSPRERIDLAHPLIAANTVVHLGYDRQIQRVGRRVRDGREQLIVQYLFASGFGEKRRLYPCVILAGEAPPTPGERVVTSDARLAAASMRSGWHQARRGARWWIVSDENLLRAASPALNDWIASQPADRTIEIHRDVAAIYQTGAATSEAVESLSESMEALLQLISVEPAAAESAH